MYILTATIDILWLDYIYYHLTTTYCVYPFPILTATFIAYLKPDFALHLLSRYFMVHLIRHIFDEPFTLDSINYNS